MVAKNYCLMKLRDKGKLPVEINDRLMATPDESEGKDAFLQKDISLRNLETALQLLNKEQQLCVTLFYLHKHTYQQISASSGFSVTQVKSHIQNGKRNLKIHLEKMDQHER